MRAEKTQLEVCIFVCFIFACCNCITYCFLKAKCIRLLTYYWKRHLKIMTFDNVLSVFILIDLLYFYRNSIIQHITLRTIFVSLRSHSIILHTFLNIDRMFVLSVSMPCLILFYFLMKSRLQGYILFLKNYNIFTLETFELRQLFEPLFFKLVQKVWMSVKKLG